MVDVYKLGYGDPAVTWFAEWFLADPMPPYTVDFTTAQCPSARKYPIESCHPCRTHCYSGTKVTDTRHIWILTGEAKPVRSYWYMEARWPD
jgi:hypothetical protein